MAERCPSMHNAVGLIPNTTKRTKKRWTKTELVTSHIVQRKATLNTGEGSQDRLIKCGKEIIHRDQEIKLFDEHIGCGTGWFGELSICSLFI